MLPKIPSAGRSKLQADLTAERGARLNCSRLPWQKHLPTIEERLKQQEALEISRKGHVKRHASLSRLSFFSRTRSDSTIEAEEDVKPWSPSDSFRLAQKQYSELIAKEQFDYRRNDAPSRYSASGAGISKRRFGAILASEPTLGEPSIILVRSGASYTPVLVKMNTTTKGCAVEFLSKHSPTEVWKKSEDDIALSQPICRYRRPLEFKESGQWNLHARVVSLTSGKVGPWLPCSFQIDCCTDQKPVPVVRCVIRTQLRVPLEDGQNGQVFEQALQSVLEDVLLSVHVRQMSYNWPKLDMHYAVRSASCDNTVGACHYVMNTIRGIAGGALGARWAAQLHRFGIEIVPAETIFLGGTVRNMYVEDEQPLEKQSSYVRCAGMPRKIVPRLEMRHAFLVMRALLLGMDRVHTRGCYAYEAGWLEGTCQMPQPLFRLILSFV